MKEMMFFGVPLNLEVEQQKDKRKDKKLLVHMGIWAPLMKHQNHLRFSTTVIGIKSTMRFSQVGGYIDNSKTRLG